MRVASFEVRVIQIPMRVSVKHALAERKVARNVLVTATDTEGRTGWGESCPREYVTGESVPSVLHDLEHAILPGLKDVDFETLEGARDLLLTRLDGLRRDQHAAFCAAELAVLDLLARGLGRSAGDVAGPVLTDPLVYSGVVAATDPEGVAMYADGLAKMGISIIKVKVVEDLEENLRILGSVREIVGPDARLRIDANAAWTVDEALRQLEAMAEYGLEGVEQPLAADDHEGLVRLTAAGVCPVVVDETLVSMDDARRLVDERGCDVFNVRISKNGGLCNALRLHALAEEAGLRCQLGAQVAETGILSAAGRQYAARSADVLWCEGSYGKLLLDEDPVEPDITIGAGGRAPALTGPGLGVDPVTDRVEALTAERLAV